MVEHRLTCFSSSTRDSSFEPAGLRLGASVINMQADGSSVTKGETLLDTARTLNAMHVDALVICHPDSGALQLLAEHVQCAVINGGDGTHEHPTQALLDALTIRRHKGHIAGLEVAICGDITHSRVARSNIHLLHARCPCSCDCSSYPYAAGDPSSGECNPSRTCARVLRMWMSS